ncbi:cell wall hydrolase [Bacillus litorisediminis]|uniref:cell wall hydrolase n=1 Tax=Bacillus litorisediminis TaxID=2922713 RepID=UPI001FAE5824|nr:cell wall hydrolase [Bacillus litorisediminis]
MKKILFLFNIITLVIASYTVISPQIKAESENRANTEDSLSLLYQSNGYGTKLMDQEEKSVSPAALIEKKDTFLKMYNGLTISPEEIKLLARLVHAEAKGEPYVGKVAVATVVLNRVEHHQFPDTVKEVIYEKNAFEPILNGSINEPADKEAYKAVHEALVDQAQDEGNSEELLYFYNPETATSDWIFTRETVKTIGNHAFAI